MKIIYLLTLLAFLNNIAFVILLNPLLVAIGSVAATTILPYLYNKEKCNENWTSVNASKTGNYMEKYLYGQHLVQELVPKAITNHVNDPHPKKALVLSFHGYTGCGKNFVSDIIIKHLYLNGANSQFVHKYIAGIDFSHKSLVEEYKRRIQNDIITVTKNCQKNIFIFDEVEKMPEGLLDVLKPFIDFHENVKGVDYRKNTFIFLSNLGGKDILEFTLKHLKTGKDRETITSKEMEGLLRRASFNENGGFKFAEVLSSALIDFQIPFLPLEKKHVRECILTELKRQNKDFKFEVIEQIAKELDYFPENEEIFSQTGCKNVLKKVLAFI